MSALIALMMPNLTRAGDDPAAILEPAIQLPPGDYLWLPELAPRGPVVILISLPHQLAFVYRNGVRIGIATISAGKPGFETPTGIFTILQKHREHYSNRYDNAPMPYMQRLTWDGLALHAGKIPGYPASHGCVRLPYAFAKQLFAITRLGMTVVIANHASQTSAMIYPGLLAPIEATTGKPHALPSPTAASVWMPELAPDGPVTVVLNTREGQIIVLRNGIKIGWAPMQIAGEPPRGSQAFVLLGDGSRSDGPNSALTEPPGWRWLAIPGDDQEPIPSGLPIAERFVIAPAFLQQVYDVLIPGATLIVTDEPSRPGRTGISNAAVLPTDAKLVPVSPPSD